MALKSRVRSALDPVRAWSLKAATEWQGLGQLSERLAGIAPDLSRQYTSYELSALGIASLRAVHAFQIDLAIAALMRLGTDLTVVDVGDSAGTHLAYLQAIRHDLTGISVNLDPTAVERITAKGGRAIHSDAKDLPLHGIRPDLVLCFETLEHLDDPLAFLRSTASLGAPLALTVPFQRRSRVGLRHIRAGVRQRVNPETVHIFELAPADWRLLFQHSGWLISEERVFYQYPPPLRPVLGPLWRRLDFEGFYGAVLIPDASYSNLYGF